jgi:hypothetical protein
MLSLATLLIAALNAVQAPPSAPPDVAVVVNSGSTNTAGYRIIIRPNGSATYIFNRASASAPAQTLSPLLTRTFFRDLAAARPFTALPPGPCMKSASFGTKTFVDFRAASTPDLSCAPAESKSSRVYQDILNIERYLHVPYRNAQGRRYLQ